MNIKMMIENIRHFFFEEESQKNTVTLQNNNFSCFSSSIFSEQAGIYDYKSFKAIYDIANYYCNMPNIEDIQSPKIIDEYCLHIDKRFVHMIQDHDNHVILIGFNEKEQTAKSKMKTVSTESEKFKVSSEYTLLNDGIYRFVFVPEGLMFNGINDMIDVDLFLDVISFYMWYMKRDTLLTNHPDSDLVLFNQPYVSIMMRYIAICIYFLYTELENIDKEAIQTKIIRSSQRFWDDKDTKSLFFKDCLEEIIKIYERTEKEEFLSSIIYGNLEVL